MNKVTFRKLFYNIKEMDYGSYQPAIIVWEKRPLTYRTRVLPEEEAKKTGFNVETVVEKYTYHLQVDLYFVIFRFNW